MGNDQLKGPFKKDKWMAFFIYAIFAFILFGLKLWLINEYGNATPFWDQWDAEAVNLYRPLSEGTLGIKDMLAPHNEHRILFTRILALIILKVNIIWNPLLQMIVNAALHVLTIIFTTNLLVRVLGQNYLPSLLVFSTTLFGIPYAWENTLAGFQSQFYFVFLFSVATIWFVLSGSPLSRNWWLGILCSFFAFFSLASGIFAIAAAAGVSMMFYVTGINRSIKQLAAIIILTGLLILGLIFTPTLEHHAVLKATSFSHFTSAMVSILSWPLPPSIFSVIIRNFPALIFAGILLYELPSVLDKKWFLFGLVVWSLGQSISVAYGRAAVNLSSRYLDLFAIGIFINFACLLFVSQYHSQKIRNITSAGIGLWITIICVFLSVSALKDLPEHLTTKRNEGLAQEINVRNYLITGDTSHLVGKTLLDIPYPDPFRLAMILNWPEIRKILPANLSPSVNTLSVKNVPLNSFVINGYYFTTPSRKDSSWGSYNAHGDSSIGELKFKYNTIVKGDLEIPISGYPMGDNMKLELEQNGQLIPIAINENPRESWKTGYASVGEGFFYINVTDGSNNYWTAVGKPVINVYGRLDGLANRILNSFYLFIITGVSGFLFLIILSSLKNSHTDRKTFN